MPSHFIVAEIHFFVSFLTGSNVTVQISSVQRVSVHRVAQTGREIELFITIVFKQQVESYSAVFVGEILCRDHNTVIIIEYGFLDGRGFLEFIEFSIGRIFRFLRFTGSFGVFGGGIGIFGCLLLLIAVIRIAVVYVYDTRGKAEHH